MIFSKGFQVLKGCDFSSFTKGFGGEKFGLTWGKEMVQVLNGLN